MGSGAFWEEELANTKGVIKCFELQSKKKEKKNYQGKITYGHVSFTKKARLCGEVVGSPSEGLDKGAAMIRDVS